MNHAIIMLLLMYFFFPFVFYCVVWYSRDIAKMASLSTIKKNSWCWAKLELGFKPQSRIQETIYQHNSTVLLLIKYAQVKNIVFWKVTESSVCAPISQQRYVYSEKKNSLHFYACLLVRPHPISMIKEALENDAV